MWPAAGPVFCSEGVRFTGGAAAVIDAVVDRLRGRDIPVVRVSGRRLERDDVFGALSGLAPDGIEPTDERSWRDALVSRMVDQGAALVVDDAQWLDTGSLRVIVGVAERASAQGLTVTVAHRDRRRIRTPATASASLANKVIKRSIRNSGFTSRRLWKI